MVDIETLVEILQESCVKVTFRKVDGTVTTRIFTKNLNFIPTENHPKGVGTAKEGVTPVWDVESDGWRSFRNDSVTSWERA